MQPLTSLSRIALGVLLAMPLAGVAATAERTPASA